MPAVTRKKKAYRSFAFSTTEKETERALPADFSLNFTFDGGALTSKICSKWQYGENNAANFQFGDVYHYRGGGQDQLLLFEPSTHRLYRMSLSADPVSVSLLSTGFTMLGKAAFFTQADGKERVASHADKRTKTHI